MRARSHRVVRLAEATYQVVWFLQKKVGGRSQCQPKGAFH